MSDVYQSRERSGSVVECTTRNWGATGSSLTGVTVLWSLSKTHYPSLILVQPRKTRPCLTERLLMGHKDKIKCKNGKCSKILNTFLFLFSNNVGNQGWNSQNACQNSTQRRLWLNWVCSVCLGLFWGNYCSKFFMWESYKESTLEGKKYCLRPCILETPEHVFWQTVKTKMKCRKMLHFIRVCNDGLDKNDCRETIKIFLT